MPKDYRDDDRQRSRRRSRSRSKDRSGKRNRDRDSRRSRDRDDYRRKRDKDDYKRRTRSRSPDRKKHKHRSRSPRKTDDSPVYERKRVFSVSSTPSEDERFDDKLEALRQEKLEKKKLEKERMKELETPEEKRARRLEKKRRKEESDKIESISGGISYNNLNNPFNDTNLTEAFVWNKKLEREGLTSLSKKELDELHQEKVRKNLKEMEELKRNRQARQAAREDMELLAREQEKQMYGSYTMVEYKFHVKQARERTKIRIRENRPKPIDLLVRYSVFGVPEEEKDYDEFELVDPLTYIKNLSIDDFEDIIADIKTYKKISVHKDDAFWDDMLTICEGELEKLQDIRKKKEMDEAVHSSVREDVLSKFKGKSYNQLAEMEKSLRDTISKNPGNGFFQAVLDQLLPYMAKQRIKERHKEKMALKLQRIREEQAREMAEHQKNLGDIKPAMSMKEKLDDGEEKKIVLPDIDEMVSF